MKRIKAFIFFYLLIFSCGFVHSKEFVGTKFNIQDAKSVSDRANQLPSVGGDGILSDPFVDAAMGGIRNVVQGFNNNTYNMQEQQKQQADYAKQQVNN